MAVRIEGVRVGHVEDFEGVTGCTVVLLPPGTRGGVEVRGGAPGTRETDLLDPLCLVEEVHAFVLAGGSAFGLAASTGVVRFLEESGVGFDTGVARVPIVPAGVIYDLGIGDPSARPDEEMGYRACRRASEELMGQGNVGAGMGATVGKILGYRYCTKGGLGTAFFEGENLKVFAMAVVNAFGDVVDEDGRILAGVRDAGGGFLSTERVMRETAGERSSQVPGTNTTLGVVVCNARLSKADVNWVARRGHHGLARAISPSHTKLDGDLVFAAATGEVEASADLVGALGASLLAEAVRSAVRHAESVAGVPAARDVVRR